MHDYLDSCDVELSQSHFYRMFALGSFDSFITLPITITDLATTFVTVGPRLIFYQGWTSLHSGWEPVHVSKGLWSMEKSNAFLVYWAEWIDPFLALVFFALFGLTPGARKGYRRFILSLGRPFGVTQVPVETTEDVLPQAVFKSGRGTNATITSNITGQ